MLPLCTVLLAASLPLVMASDPGDLSPLSPLSPPPPSPPPPPPPLPTSASWQAALLRRFTSWDEARIAAAVGDVPAWAPHPFVRDVMDGEEGAAWAGAPEEEVWAVLVSAHDPASQAYDEAFSAVALNSSLALARPPAPARADSPRAVRRAAGDPGVLPGWLKFARVDFMGRTDRLLTQWLVFKAPVLVVITRSGEELRFFGAGAVPARPAQMAEFLRSEIWRRRKPWRSRFSPSGSWSWLPRGLAVWFELWHALLDAVPGWVLMLASSSIASGLMGWMHSGDAERQRRFDAGRRGGGRSTSALATEAPEAQGQEQEQEQEPGQRQKDEKAGAAARPRGQQARSAGTGVSGGSAEAVAGKTGGEARGQRPRRRRRDEAKPPPAGSPPHAANAPSAGSRS